MKIDFDEATHTYRVNGVVMPSVTTILDQLQDWWRIDVDVLERAKQIGNAVHRATELDDKGTLVEESVDPIVAPYLEGWRKFKAHFMPEMESIEEIVYNPLGFCGTPDRVARIKQNRTLLDIKSGSVVSPTWGLQTAAYRNSIIPFPADRAVVHLMGDGTYRYIPQTDSTDWPTFLAALSLFNWRKKHAN